MRIASLNDEVDANEIYEEIAMQDGGEFCVILYRFKFTNSSLYFMPNHIVGVTTQTPSGSHIFLILNDQ